MKEINGSFWFEGEEIDDAFRWMWNCLCDLSLKGKLETIVRIILRKPPKLYYPKYQERLKGYLKGE